jgi:hypothetical protein
VQQPESTFPPQDGALGVGHEHDVHGLVGDAHEGAVQQRHDLAQRMRRAQVGQVGVADHHGGCAPVRVDLRGQAASP